MQRNPSRTERRAEKYFLAQARGQTSTMDTLYKSEIRKLEKDGYTINVVSTVPNLKDLWLCEVIFPKQG